MKFFRAGRSPEQPIFVFYFIFFLFFPERGGAPEQEFSLRRVNFCFFPSFWCGAQLREAEPLGQFPLQLFVLDLLQAKVSTWADFPSDFFSLLDFVPGNWEVGWRETEACALGRELFSHKNYVFKARKPCSNLPLPLKTYGVCYLSLHFPHRHSPFVPVLGGRQASSPCQAAGRPAVRAGRPAGPTSPCRALFVGLKPAK